MIMIDYKEWLDRRVSSLSALTNLDGKKQRSSVRYIEQIVGKPLILERHNAQRAVYTDADDIIDSVKSIGWIKRG